MRPQLPFEAERIALRTRREVDLSGIYQDFRFAVRVLAKRPGFTLLAVVALALGIGANSAVFGLVNAMLLRPLAMERPEELLGVYSKDLKNPDSYRPFSYPNYVDLREQDQVFTSLMAHNLALVGVTEGESTRRVFADIVSSNYFATLGTPIFLGRGFTEEEEKPGAGSLAVIVGHEYWRRAGSDPAILGRTLRINGLLFSIVGVTAPEFTGTTALVSPDVWLPLGVYERVINNFEGKARPLSDRDNHALILVGRVPSSLSREIVEERLATVAAHLAEEYPKVNQDQTFTVHPLSRLSISTEPQEDDGIATLSALLIGMAGVVLMVACLNLANMMLARGASRRKELAIRVAIGGSRRQVIRQLLSEGLLLSLLGGAAGLLLAQMGTGLLIASLESIAPITIVFHQGADWRVLGATLLFAVVSTLASGLWPALKLSRPNLVTELRENSGEDVATGGSRFFNSRNFLVLGQMALSLVLLTSAGLFVRGAFKAGDLDAGFALDQLLVETDPGLVGRDEAHGREVLRTLRERLSTLPGVESVSLAATVPFGMVSLGQRVVPAELKEDPNDPESRGKSVSAGFNVVGAAYFETMGTPILRGRSFNAAEMEPGAPAVAVIDQTLAEKLWPGQDPLGRELRFTKASVVNRNDLQSDPKSSALQVVGVVAPIQDGLFGRRDRPHVFIPFGQQYQSNVHFHLRLSSLAPKRVAEAAEEVRREFREVDAVLPILNLRTMPAHLDASAELWIVRTGARLFGVLAAMALFLAVVGLYGVRAYTVARRTREIGIRIALGSTTGQALRLVLKEGLLLSVAGVTLGLLLSGLAGQLVSSFLFDVSATDPLTFLVAPSVLLSVAMLACYIPARRASRVDPLVALRYE